MVSIISRKTSGKKGLAILTGMVKEKGSPFGTQVDLDNMNNALEFLGFAVMRMEDISRFNLVAIIKAAKRIDYKSGAPSFDVIVFYFAGHGNSTDDRRPLVQVKNKELYLVEDIVSEFYPKNARKLKKIKRLFFFDMCLGGETHGGVRQDLSHLQQPVELPQPVPAEGNCLVAYANCIGYQSRGTSDKGGYWTRNLCNYITQNLEISVVLAKAWEATVKDTAEVEKDNVQGPHLTACMGCLNLYGKFY